MVKVTCTKCGNKRTVSKKGHEARIKEHPNYEKTYVCVFCKRAAIDKTKKGTIGTKKPTDSK